MLEVEEKLLGDDVDVREVRGGENEEVNEARFACQFDLLGQFVSTF